MCSVNEVALAFHRLLKIEALILPHCVILKHKSFSLSLLLTSHTLFRSCLCFKCLSEISPHVINLLANAIALVTIIVTKITIKTSAFVLILHLLLICCQVSSQTPSKHKLPIPLSCCKCTRGPPSTSKNTQRPVTSSSFPLSFPSLVFSFFFSFFFSVFSLAC